jgi:hypothetical protein
MMCRPPASSSPEKPPPPATQLLLIRQWVVPLTVHEVALADGSHSAQPCGCFDPLA